MPAAPNPMIGLVQSAVRWVIPLLYGVFGMEATEAQLGEAVSIVTAFALFAGSLFWSWREKQKLLKATPPREGGL